MAIPFLNHLDLRSVSELQNAILHKTTTATASNVEGKFLYDTGTNTMQYYNGSAWINLDGTDTGITSIELASDGDATSGNTITQNGILTLSFDGTSSQYVNGQGNLVTFPSIPTVPGNIVETIDTTNGTYIDLTPTAATDGDVVITADLSATDGTAGAGARYLTKTNKWAPVADIPGTYVWNVSDGSGSSPVYSGKTITWAGQTYITTDVTLNAQGNHTVTINHDDTSRTDTTSTASANSFTVVDSVTTNATGHVTAVNVKTQTVSGGTVTGTGTAGTIPVWASASELEDSIITDNGTTVTIGGNLDVQGTTTTIDSTTVAIGDNMMKYAKDNTANASDIGWYGKIVSSGTKYPAMFYDASTGVSTPKFQLGIANTEPAGTGTINTKGTLVADLEGNADTATTLETSRNFSITGDITASTVSFNGSGNVVLNANIDANVVGATELNVSGNGTSGYLLSSDGDGSFSWVAAGAAPSDATITLNPGDGLDGGGAFTLNQASNETITFSAENASTTNKGVVELATCAEVLTGTDGSRVVTPDTLACKSVTATISAASVSGTNLYAEITHSLGTEDVMVELFDASTKETVFALVERKDKSGTNSTSKITVYFSAVPSNNIEVLITSLKGATTGTVAYS